MNHAPHLPKILQATIKAIQKHLPDAIRDGVFSHADRKHAMHSQFVRTLERVLCALIARIDLASGVFCRRGKRRKALVSLTLKDMVRITGLAKSTVCAALAYLKGMGLLFGERQLTAGIERPAGSSRAVGSCFRRLSPAFWRLMGLEEEFLEEAGKAMPKTIARVFARRGTTGPNKGRLLEVPQEEARCKTPPPADRGRAGQDGVWEAIQRCAAARLAAQK